MLDRVDEKLKYLKFKFKLNFKIKFLFSQFIARKQFKKKQQK